MVNRLIKKIEAYKMVMDNFLKEGGVDVENSLFSVAVFVLKLISAFHV